MSSYENKYDINSVQKITNECLPGYTVLDIKRVSDGSKYGHKWRILLKCPNEKHPPYWTELQVIKHKHPCRKCIEEAEYLTSRKKNIILKACAKNSCNFLELIPSNKTRFQDIVLKVEDKDGYWYNISLDHLRNRKMEFKIKFLTNPYFEHNIQIWCSLNRPDYLFCEGLPKTRVEKCLFKYIGDEEDMEESERFFSMSFSNFVKIGGSHPKLTKLRHSYGSFLVKDFLKSNNISFEQEKTFDNLVSKRGAHLFFDFYLQEHNVAIEVDGVQHFEPVECFGGLSAFSYRLDNDQRKNIYCEQHNIRLLRIPYYLYGSKKHPKGDYLKLLDELI